MVSGYVPSDPALGVPLRVAVALLPGAKVIPAGKVPLTRRVDFGLVFEAFTVKLLAFPSTKVALFTVVIRGGLLIVSVKLCVAAGLTPLDAVNVIA